MQVEKLSNYFFNYYVLIKFLADQFIAELVLGVAKEELLQGQESLESYYPEPLYSFYGRT